MIPTAVSLRDFFHQHAARHEPLVLATIVHTLGSTYRKAGAQMLIAADGRAAGLLSGGCLEPDLIQRAHLVLADGGARIAQYDTRTSDDLIWGIGLGCEGAMTILLTRLDHEHDYQPFAFIDLSRRQHLAAKFALVIQSRSERFPLGAAFWPDSAPAAPRLVGEALDPLPGQHDRDPPAVLEAEDAQFLILPVTLPPRLLVLGAGPDALPLVRIAALLEWQVTVFDHRPAYAVPDRFPQAHRVVSRPATELELELRQGHYQAAVVMSHHLPSDLRYLQALAAGNVPYIGLLGPAPRRVRLMSELGERAAALAGRLYGPVGLDIGADTPETIALAIVAEIQAILAGRSGSPFSRLVD